jgi:hypothetical protein
MNHRQSTRHDAKNRAFPALLIRLGCAILFAAPLLHAQSADEIMAKHFRIPKPVNSALTMAMTITKNGKTLSRTMSTWAVGDNARGEVERKIIKFVGPADIAGSGFLSAKKPDGSTETQLWLPAMGKVRRLSSGASDQDQAFFGSDFNNRDISGYAESEFTYELKGQTPEGFTVEAKPKGGSIYEKLVFTIEPKDYASVKIDFIKGGQVAKSQSASYAVIGKYRVPESITMRSATGSTTLIRIRDQKVDIDLNPQIFTERNLVQ